MKSNSLLTNYLYAFASATIYGFLVFGAGLIEKSGFSLIEILIIPNSIVFIILVYFVRKDIKSFLNLPLLIGFLYAASCMIAQIGQFAPLFMGVSVSLTLFILYTQPIWTILISTIFLKAKFTMNEAITAFLVIVGLIFLISPWKDFSYSIWGVVWALTGGLCLSIWVVLASNISKRGIKPLTTTFFTNIYSSIPFIIAIPLVAKILPDPEISSLSFDKPILAIILVFIYSISIFIGAQMFFYKAAKKVKSIHLGLILLMEPVVGTILDISFLGTSLTWNIALGGGLILLGNVVLIAKFSENKDE